MICGARQRLWILNGKEPEKGVKKNNKMHMRTHVNTCLFREKHEAEAGRRIKREADKVRGLYEGGEVEHQFERPRVCRRVRTWENGSGEVGIKGKIRVNVSKEMPTESEGAIQVTPGAQIASSKSLLFLSAHGQTPGRD